MSHGYHILDRALDTRGDGEGATNAIGDHTPENFQLIPAADELIIVKRVIILIEDVAIVNAAGYGGLAALSNGITVTANTEDGLFDLTNGVPITTNGVWAGKCFDVDRQAWGGTGDYFTARWSFNLYSSGIKLSDPSHYFRFALNDDFTGLDQHLFTAQGVIEPKVT